MLYESVDLLFKDYDWTHTADHAKFKGVPDRNLFMRTEGNDVLYIVNYVCAKRNYQSKTHAGKMEILIHEKLPIGIKSQNSVFNWLQENYIE